MRLKKILAMLAVSVFAATAVACASMPADDTSGSQNSSSRSESEPPEFY